MINEEETKKEELQENNTTNSDESFSDVEFVESTEDGEALSGKDISKKLREDLKICRKEKEEYLTGWQRAKADYINLQKEIEVVRLGAFTVAKEKVVEKLLPAFDSFEMAFSNKEHWEKLDKEWQDGIKSIHKQFLTGLISSGVEQINEAEIPFNPNIHESVSMVSTDDESKDHTIEKILQIGYKIGERVIRPAKVSIYEYKK